jgi:hypothetical protein
VAYDAEPDSPVWPMTRNQIPYIGSLQGMTLVVEYLCNFETVFETTLVFESGFIRPIVQKSRDTVPLSIGKRGR